MAIPIADAAKLTIRVGAAVIDVAPGADPHSFWRRLRDLFGYVDFGASAYGINTYNGGLFSDEEKPYLKDHNIANDFLAPALYALGYEETKSGVAPIDYRDLSVRRLGTLYEGLLEFKLNIVKDEQYVVRESGGKKQFVPISVAAKASPIKKSETILEIGDVCFADDKGERKLSGSYYTPEDVVQYIASNTVAPKLADRREPPRSVSRPASTKPASMAGLPSRRPTCRAKVASGRSVRRLETGRAPYRR
ncbi:MAG: hypothetical protein P4L33_11370 [Capsulimonadaceae bacterium]|nr:hypothetical protein [Capsulimonadaceae bacterium]